MRVLVTGASGWIGSAVVPELLSNGHQVVGLARSDGSAAAIEALGAEVVRGDMTDGATLAAAASDADGVIHLAFVHDFSNFAASIDIDARAIETIGSALAGSQRPFVIASGTPAVPGKVATEDDEAPPGPLAGRGETGRRVIALADNGIRSGVVRLPRSVHGEGDSHGFVPQLAAMAREQGVAGYVGDGAARWPAVHVADAASLFRLALERGPAGSVWHAVGDEGVPGIEIATAIGRRLDLPTASVPAEQLGFLGMLLSMDQPASSSKAQEVLGWKATHPSLIADIDAGHYLADAGTPTDTAGRPALPSIDTERFRADIDEFIDPSL